jgi:hypothetical protein
MTTGDDSANDILDSIYGTGHAAAWPSTYYVTLYEVAPTDAGGGTELSYAGFDRVAVANTDANFPAAAAREKVLAVVLEFAVPAADTPDIVAWGIHRHITNDALAHWNLFTQPLAGSAGKDLIIPAETLAIFIP